MDSASLLLYEGNVRSPKEPPQEIHVKKIEEWALRTADCLRIPIPRGSVDRETSFRSLASDEDF